MIKNRDLFEEEELMINESDREFEIGEIIN